jgi:hypothetical protein
MYYYSHPDLRCKRRLTPHEQQEALRLIGNITEAGQQMRQIMDEAARYISESLKRIARTPEQSYIEVEYERL